MKTVYIITSIIIAAAILTINQTVNAQLANSTSYPLTKIIEEKYTRQRNIPGLVMEPELTVKVRYEGPSVIVLEGGLITPDSGRYNSDLWSAMELLKNQYKFNLSSTFTTGLGTVEDPTVIYLVMTK